MRLPEKVDHMRTIKIMYKPVQEKYHPTEFNEANYCCMATLPRIEFSKVEEEVIQEVVRFTAGAAWLLDKGRPIQIGDIIYVSSNKYRFIWDKDKDNYPKKAISRITDLVSVVLISPPTEVKNDR